MMIRSVLAGFLFSFVAVSSASALNCPSYPFTLANGNNADATQVMGNFTTIMNCANTSLAATSGATFTGPTFFTGGNVGIGTTSPDKILTVSGAIPGPGGVLATIRTTGSINGGALALDAAGTGNANLNLSVAGVNKAAMGYDVSRNFVGLINFAYSLDDFSLRVNADGSLTYNDGASGAEHFRVTAAGSVGIGTATPAYTLQVNGSVAGTSAYNNTSDGRLKKDIASLEYGLDTIMKLRPVGFNWITQDQEWKKQHQIGLIAQEVEALVPEVVTTAKDELQTKSLAYGALVPVLIKAIQDLKAENNNLRAANDNEAGKIATLSARLDAIEAAHMTKAAATSPSLLR